MVFILYFATTMKTITFLIRDSGACPSPRFAFQRVAANHEPSLCHTMLPWGNHIKIRAENMGTSNVSIKTSSSGFI